MVTGLENGLVESLTAPLGVDVITKAVLIIITALEVEQIGAIVRAASNFLTAVNKFL